MTDLANALRDLKEKEVYSIVNERLKNGQPALQILSELNQGMVGVGERFSEQTYFISELIFSTNIFKNAMARIEPRLESGSEAVSLGKVIIGTVKGDVHDIGKNIVVALLRGSGFDVIDLGVDVPSEKFVEAIKETGARVLGMSALLNTTYPAMKKVVDSLTQAGLRENIEVIIGGAPCNEQVRDFTGADHYAKDAVDGFSICKQIYA